MATSTRENARGRGTQRTMSPVNSEERREPSLSWGSPSAQEGRPRRTLGILSDRETDQVPGSVLLLSGSSKRNAPLGVAPAGRTSATSIPSPYAAGRSSSIFSRRNQPPEKKRTADGKIILDPQPDESQNDPLNWSTIRRDAALLSLGLYCMVGGGMTPILAAGFTNVAATYNVTIPQVALTTGLYMMGLGLGSVVMSPTAILFGKRPVYLITALIFILTSVWCALSPTYTSLVIARVVQGVVVSPVECLPSATIAEIFFLHERAYRLGVYTLLLLGGKNLVPLVSAAIVQSLGWRWVFWMVAIIVGLCVSLLFFCVPETFWDRTPRPHHKQHNQRRPSLGGLRRWSRKSQDIVPQSPKAENEKAKQTTSDSSETSTPLPELQVEESHPRRAHFAMEDDPEKPVVDGEDAAHPVAEVTSQPSDVHNLNLDDVPPNNSIHHDVEAIASITIPSQDPAAPKQPYTAYYQSVPRKSYVASLSPFNGRLSHHSWHLIAIRPFILFIYPSILWSTAVYSLSVGWLIVLSESVASIYRNHDTYSFTALQTGLVYISPFVGGVLGTAAAGKLSDLIVRYMARRNGGVYEPEFRLVMAIPVALATTIGLMGYGWSIQERDAWIVPTTFFGIISFGCSLGSTTAITFAVDSYRQYAGEALVTLNFAKNILHGLVFSLFFNKWLEGDGPKDVFLALGGIQLAVLATSVPMYLYGKRARMWTVRRNFMEKF